MPMDKKALLIFAHHTSNWDFPTMLLAKFAWGLKVRYLGKHTLFNPLTGWFFKAFGGIPVYRDKNNDVVGQIVQLIKESDSIYLALSPEGTRSYKPYWKTGFYHIAQRSNIPIVMFYLDQKTRTIGYSDIFYLSSDIDADMMKIKQFYTDKHGYKQDNASLIQTKEQYLNVKETNIDGNDKQ